MDEKELLKYRNTALLLAVITIVYNIAEGLVSTWFGATDETLALFGFGIDSFVEVLSGLGIAHMILRMKRNSVELRDRFEIAALKLTGKAFYLLVAGLVFGSALSVAYGLKPHTTVVGIIVASISIATMYMLYRQKLKVGRALNSNAIISDAHCTKTCFYLSFILLASSVLYEWFHVPYSDAVGSLGIAWYAFREGKEAFEKAKSLDLNDPVDCC